MFVAALVECLEIAVLSAWILSFFARHPRLAPAARRCSDGFRMVRRGLPTTVGGVDFTPIIVVFSLEVIRHTILSHAGVG